MILRIDGDGLIEVVLEVMPEFDPLAHSAHFAQTSGQDGGVLQRFEVFGRQADGFGRVLLALDDQWLAGGILVPQSGHLAVESASQPPQHLHILGFLLVELKRASG